MSATKICSREDCQHLGEPQPISNFYKDNLRPAGYRCNCKDCTRVWQQSSAGRTSSRNAATRHRQSPSGKVARAQYFKSPAGKAAKKRHQQSEKGKASYKRAFSLYRQTNRISYSITNRINKSLRGNKNGAHWEDIVGFTLNDLMHHLEKQFTDGMTWDNYGKWEIDHIIPITAFNFSSFNDYDFKRCWALNNLQPLWEADNIHKSDKVIGGFQPSLVT